MRSKSAVTTSARATPTRGTLPDSDRCRRLEAKILSCCHYITLLKSESFLQVNTLSRLLSFLDFNHSDTVREMYNDYARRCTAVQLISVVGELVGRACGRPCCCYCCRLFITWRPTYVPGEKFLQHTYGLGMDSGHRNYQHLQSNIAHLCTSAQYS